MTRSRLHASAARQALIIGVSALSLLVAACDANQAPLPSAPSPVPPDPSQLVVFGEPSGFSTTEVRDAQDHIVQFTAGGDLVWTADGTHLPGYAVDGSGYWGPPTYFISGKICVEGCVFSVRFGTRDGQRQAFLTVDYGHENPGTLVDVNVVGGALVVRQTTLFPPGTPSLFGVVTEVTPTGSLPVAGVSVACLVPAGWQQASTDENGFYRISGLIEGTERVEVAKAGYLGPSTQVALSGDVRFDIQLVRR